MDFKGGKVIFDSSLDQFIVFSPLFDYLGHYATRSEGEYAITVWEQKMVLEHKFQL